MGHFINIHTHIISENKYSIHNLFPEDAEQIKEGLLYSIGIHPWEVKKGDIKKQIRIVETVAMKKNIQAIGEIGLDRLRDNFDLQKDVFLKQIIIAKEQSKPVIIHCVKAFSELLEILKKEKLNIPIIIHRYSGNKTIADELIKHGCYLSFGHELFNRKSKVQRIFKSISLKHIFLETDDSEVTIEEIYKKAAEIQKTDVEEIQKTIFSNFNNCFNI
ncbi:MAG: TatD family hydrolase [Bacteroidales bacterium]|nr:TatD family hydrolase [Bacteroidales bacterium]